MIVQPYLNFAGRCAEALEFYGKSVGAEVGMMMRFKDAPETGPGSQPPPENVMHAAFRIGETTLFATDGGTVGKAHFEGITLSLSASSDTEAARLFKALGDGGQVTVPMNKTFFASSFGMLVDRFGVTWMVLVPVENRPA